MTSSTSRPSSHRHVADRARHAPARRTRGPPPRTPGPRRLTPPSGRRPPRRRPRRSCRGRAARVRRTPRRAPSRARPRSRHRPRTRPSAAGTPPRRRGGRPVRPSAAAVVRAMPDDAALRTGARPDRPTSAPRARCVIAVLPATTMRRTPVERRRPPRPAPRRCRRPRASAAPPPCPASAAEMRLATSPPNVRWGFGTDASPDLESRGVEQRGGDRGRAEVDGRDDGGRARGRHRRGGSAGCRRRPRARPGARSAATSRARGTRAARPRARRRATRPRARPEGGGSPARTRTAQSPHVPAPAAGRRRAAARRARAASSSVVPTGTSTVTSGGLERDRRRSRTSPSPAARTRRRSPLPVCVAMTVPVSATCISVTSNRASIASRSHSALSARHRVHDAERARAPAVHLLGDPVHRLLQHGLRAREPARRAGTTPSRTQKVTRMLSTEPRNAVTLPMRPPFARLSSLSTPDDHLHAVAHALDAREHLGGRQALGRRARGLEHLPAESPRQVERVEDVHAAAELPWPPRAPTRRCRTDATEMWTDTTSRAVSSARSYASRNAPTDGCDVVGSVGCGVHPVEELRLRVRPVRERLVADGDATAARRRCRSGRTISAVRSAVLSVTTRMRVHAHPSARVPRVSIVDHAVRPCARPPSTCDVQVRARSGPPRARCSR